MTTRYWISTRASRSGTTLVLGITPGADAWRSGAAAAVDTERVAQAGSPVLGLRDVRLRIERLRFGVRLAPTGGDQLLAQEWVNALSEVPEILIVLISSLFGGSGAAYITNNQFGRQYSIREDRKRVLDEYLPKIWDQALLLDPRVESTPGSARARTRKDPAAVGDLQDSIWRSVQRTTWRDRRAWARYDRADLEISPSSYRIAHRTFEMYLLRQFERGPMRTWRWLSDKDHIMAMKRREDAWDEKQRGLQAEGEGREGDE